MNKKKFLSLIFLFIFFFSFFIIGDVFAAVKTNSRPKITWSNRYDRKFHLTGFSGTSSNNGYAYCYNWSKTGPPTGTTATKKSSTITKGSVLCALNTGAPSGSSDAVFMKTQLALWKVQHGKNALPKNSSSSHSYAKNAVSIYEKCKNETNYTVKPTISISKITGNTKSSNGKYILTVSVKKSNVKNYKIKSVTGISDASFPTGDLTSDSFKITIDEKKVTKKLTLKIALKATGTEKYADVYNMGNWQPLIILMQKTSSATTEKDVSLSPTYYEATVKKVDSSEENNMLSKAEFAIYKNTNCSGNPISTISTNENGVAKFTDLLTGSYSVKEVKAPEGYVLNEACTPAKLGGEVVVKNSKQTFSLEVKKVDASNEELVIAGAKINLYSDSDCSKYVATSTTDETGMVKFDGLENKNYYVKEVEAPEEYLVNNTCTTAKPDTITVLTDAKKYEITITKIDSKDSDSYLKDAEFTLYPTANCTGQPVTTADGKPVTATTDIKGIATFSNLDLETYSIKETKAPEGYKINEECFDQDDGNAITVTDDKYHSLSVKKIDSVNDGIFLNGAEFNLYLGEDCKGNPIDTGITEANGIVMFNELTEDKYSLKETKAPEGYKLNDECLNTEVGETLIVPNQKYQSITIKKSDKNDDNKFLENAKFDLYEGLECNGNPIKEGSSNKDGEVVFDKLSIGEYSVKEVKAPEGFYDILDEKLNCKGVNLSGVTSLNFTNEKVKCEFYNNKYYDENGNETTEENYNNLCNPKCKPKDGKYYNNEGNLVTEEKFYEECNPKCVASGGKYYNNSGKPVDYDTYKTDCNLMCVFKNGKYYNDKYEEVTKEEYKNTCTPKCGYRNGIYYDNEYNPVSEDKYDETCNPKCKIIKGKYYNNSGEEVDYDTYTKECKFYCVEQSGLYYDSEGNVVSKDKYNESCNAKCKKVGKKYYDENGKVTDVETFVKSCNVKCSAEGGQYFDINGKSVSIKEYYKSCNPTCNIKNNIYYNDIGKPVSKEEYEKDCSPKCEIAGGFYHNSSGSIVTEEEFNKICNPKCKIANGNYYDEYGSTVSEEEYNNSCNPKCKITGQVKYGKYGNIVSNSTYKSECLSTHTAIPDTGSPLKVILTIMGALLIIVPAVFAIKAKYFKLKK